MIRIALVSYFNTRPFIDGLQHWFADDEIQLMEMPPAECALALKNGDCDISLLPVGSLIDFEGITLMKDHCIGADGHVDSVYLFSQVPIKQTTSMVLDAHSRTSNGLAAILLKHYWEHQIPFVRHAGERFSQIEANVCGVAIGDKAFAEKTNYKYTYDLAEIWKRYCGLPFVFAVWAFRKDTITTADLERLRAALEWGNVNRQKSALKWAANYGYESSDAENYIMNSISYAFDSAKHEAMKRYFVLLKDVSQQLSVS